MTQTNVNTDEIVEKLIKLVKSGQMSKEDGFKMVDELVSQGALTKDQAGQIKSKVGQALANGQQKPQESKPESKPQQASTTAQQKNPTQTQQSKPSGSKKRLNWKKVLIPYLILVFYIGFVITLIMAIQGVFGSGLFGFLTGGIISKALTLVVIFIFIVPPVFLFPMFIINFFFPAILAIAVAWTFFMCWENYWLYVPGNTGAFVPKWGVDDGWSLSNILKPEAYLNIGLWASLIAVGLIQGFEAYSLRILGWVPGKKGDKRTAAIWGAAALFCLTLDLVTAYAHYPLFGSSLIQMLINFVYLVASAFLTELFANLLWNMLEE